MLRFNLFLFLVGVCSTAAAGPFENIGVSDSGIRVWADSVVKFQSTSSGSTADFASNSLGKADGALVSLGDLDETQIAGGEQAGSITLAFPYAITNGDGWDFAVFENAGSFFTEPFIFAELSFVEVSSNGIDFVRFPATSLNVETGSGTSDTDLITDFGRDFAGLNTTNVANLAGIHPTGFGTTFDLGELAAEAVGVDIDLNAIEFVRLVDIPGDGSVFDAAGQGILDAWPTAGGTGGFDLDAVGVRYPVPEPSSGPVILLALLLGSWWRRR